MGKPGPGKAGGTDSEGVEEALSAVDRWGSLREMSVGQPVNVARELASDSPWTLTLLALFASGASFLSLAVPAAWETHRHAVATPSDPTWLVAAPFVLFVQLLCMVFAYEGTLRGKAPDLGPCARDLFDRLPAGLATMGLLYGIRLGLEILLYHPPSPLALAFPSGAFEPLTWGWLRMAAELLFLSLAAFSLHEAVLAGRSPPAALASSVRMLWTSPAAWIDGVGLLLGVGLWTFGVFWLCAILVGFSCLCPPLLVLTLPAAAVAIHRAPLLASMAWTVVYLRTKERSS